MAAPADNHDGASAEVAPRRLVVISAGTSEPSTTRMLADRIAQRSLELLREMRVPASAGVVEVAPLAVDVARAMVHGAPSAELQAAIKSELMREAGYECEIDERPGLYEQEDPVTDATAYAGWYAQNVTGPFKRETLNAMLNEGASLSDEEFVVLLTYLARNFRP